MFCRVTPALVFFFFFTLLCLFFVGVFEGGWAGVVAEGGREGGADVRKQGSSIHSCRLAYVLFLDGLVHTPACVRVEKGSSLVNGSTTEQQRGQKYRVTY